QSYLAVAAASPRKRRLRLRAVRAPGRRVGFLLVEQASRRAERAGMLGLARRRLADHMKPRRLDRDLPKAGATQHVAHIIRVAQGHRSRRVRRLRLWRPDMLDRDVERDL